MLPPTRGTPFGSLLSDVTDPLAGRCGRRVSRRRTWETRRVIAACAASLGCVRSVGREKRVGGKRHGCAAACRGVTVWAALGRVRSVGREKPQETPRFAARRFRALRLFDNSTAGAGLGFVSRRTRCFHGRRNMEEGTVLGVARKVARWGWRRDAGGFSSGRIGLAARRTPSRIRRRAYC